MSEEKLYVDLCEGMPIPIGFPVEEFKEALKYKPRPGEIFIVAYPRSGTTWMHYIVLLILRRGKLSDDPMDFYVGCPYLEMTGSEATNYLTAAGTARSHLPYGKMPMSKDAKYIYVCRNPRDCAVSYYKQLNESSLDDPGDSKFDEFFESFLAGEVPYGDYFDHVAGWYDHKDDPNVYIVTYENLKKDTKEEILKLAKFLGNNHESALLSDSKVVDDVVRYSSFEYMRKYINDIMTQFKKGDVPSSSKENKLPPGFRKLQESIKEYGFPDEFESNFIRKGIVGDWKNYFKPDQIKMLNDKIKRRSANCNFMSLWEEDGTNGSCE